MEKLGIEPTLLIAQIVNFLIIVALLTKYLYKPILAMLEKRKKEIAEGLALTAKMQEEEERLKEKREKVLEAARKEAQGILDSVRKQAKDEEKEILAAAHKEAAVILEKGKADVERARVDMEKHVQESAITLAVAMAKRLIGNVLSSDDKHKVILKHMKDLESMKA
jgi:F-type H+-transporting ATPase subunit b